MDIKQLSHEVVTVATDISRRLGAKINRLGAEEIQSKSKNVPVILVKVAVNEQLILTLITSLFETFTHMGISKEDAVQRLGQLAGMAIDAYEKVTQESAND